MTPVQRQELRDLCDKATPGPWRMDGYEGDEGSGMFFCEGINGGGVAMPENNVTPFIFFEDIDAVFIEKSRQALPELLSEVERLAAEVERLGKVAEQAVGLAMMQIVEPERGAEAWVQAYRNCTEADRLPELAAHLERKR